MEISIVVTDDTLVLADRPANDNLSCVTTEEIAIAMTRCRIVLLLLASVLFGAIGCEEPDPGFPPIPEPKNVFQKEPGPVDPDAPEEYTTTASGLKYRIRRNSDGKKPRAKDRVRVHYRGTYENGEIFDSSYGVKSHSVEFELTGVIKGWTEGIQLIGEGGMIELIIPSDLAYGEKGYQSIPPNTTLHFLVELLDVK